MRGILRLVDADNLERRVSARGDYSIGGNYWSDFTIRYPSVEDIKSGPYQNETESDGFWDSPYVIDANNQDNYPIVPEFSCFVLSAFIVVSLFTIVISKERLMKI